MKIRRSLTAKLVLLFALITISAIFGLAGLVTLLSDEHFVHLDQQTLNDKRALILELLQRANSTDDALWLLQEALNHHPGLVVAVRTENGRLLFANNRQFSWDQTVTKDRKGWEEWHSAEKIYRVFSFTVSPHFAPNTAWTIQIAVDTETHTRFLQTFHQQILFYALLASALSVGIGWWVVYRGLASLRTIRQHATMISQNHLDRRLDDSAMPEEIATVAQELNRMLDRLQTAFVRLETFSAHLAHEMRTPLSNLLTQTQVALHSERDPETYREILASNVEEIDRLSRMVSEMLYLAKLGYSETTLAKERFLLEIELGNLVEFFEPLAEEKEISLIVAGKGAIVADRMQLRRAVSNLLSNAIRHADPGTSVTLEIGETNGQRTLSVTNVGEPIAPEHLPYLFDPFYRVASETPSESITGLGLGLAIVRAIVVAHGGSISVTSREGLTRFLLTFPHSDPDRPSLHNRCG